MTKYVLLPHTENSAGLVLPLILETLKKQKLEYDFLLLTGNYIRQTNDTTISDYTYYRALVNNYPCKAIITNNDRYNMKDGLSAELLHLLEPIEHKLTQEIDSVTLTPTIDNGNTLLINTFGINIKYKYENNKFNATHQKVGDGSFAIYDDKTQTINTYPTKFIEL